MSDQPKMLLVDDDDVAATVVAGMLATEYDVRRVDSGQAALNFLSEELPDLVLLDVDMPDIA